MLNFIVLAAGKGTRMNSTTPKILHQIGDTPMINILLHTIASYKPKNCVVITGEEEQEDIKHQIIKKNSCPVSFATQKERLGTGHATKIALEAMNSYDETDVLIIVYGDTPFISNNTIDALSAKITQDTAVAIVGFNAPTPNQYGKLIIDKGKLTAIIEDSSANAAQKQISLCNSGIMALNMKYAAQLLSEINNNNSKQEYYLTDLVAIALNQGLHADYINADYDELQGVNNKKELAHANQYYYNLLRQKALEAGVTLLDPQTTYLAHDTIFGTDVIIEGNVVIKSGVTIGNNSYIKSFSYIEESQIANNVTIGPFARIRPKSKISDDARIGNFVEIKNSVIGTASKVNHLSYIGDTDMSEEVNIGAGTITCNYDGFNKYKTSIAKGVFIGSNSALIAPVTIGSEAIIAAGSTITNNIPENAITIARANQKNIENGATKYRNKKK